MPTNCVKNDDEAHRDRVHCHDPNGCGCLAMAELMNDGDAIYCAMTNAIVAFANVIVATTIGIQFSLTSAHHSRGHHGRHSLCRVHV